MNIVLPACLIRKLVHYVFFNQLFNGFIKTKQNKKNSKKIKKRRRSCKIADQQKLVLQRIMNYAQTGFKTFFLKLSSVFSYTNLPQSNCISLPLHAFSIFDVYIYLRMYVKYTYACARVCAPDTRLPRLPFSIELQKN